MQPSADAIRAQLERIVASPQFAGSARMSRFLSYVVERALAGEGGRVKEYVIGTEVFDRDAGYDPRVDSIVRVEAGRLRGKLDEYYRDAGKEDTVRIVLGKGGYVPLFEQRQPAGTPQPATRHRGVWPVALAAAVAVLGTLSWMTFRSPPAPATDPTIAVLPLAPYGADAGTAALAEQLTERLTAALVRQGGRLGVIPSARAARFADPRAIPDDIGRQLGATYLLRGRVTAADERLQVEVVLMDSALTRKLWVDSFTAGAAAQDELAGRIATAASAAATQDLARR